GRFLVTSTTSTPLAENAFRATAGPSSPVLAWAAVGLLSFIVIVQGLARWVTGDHFRSSNPGHDPYSDAHRVAAMGVQGLCFVVALGLLWRYLLRRLFRRQPLGIEGKLALT